MWPYSHSIPIRQKLQKLPVNEIHIRVEHVRGLYRSWITLRVFFSGYGGDYALSSSLRIILLSFFLFSHSHSPTTASLIAIIEHRVFGAIVAPAWTVKRLQRLFYTRRRLPIMIIIADSGSLFQLTLAAQIFLVCVAFFCLLCLHRAPIASSAE